MAYLNSCNQDDVTKGDLGILINDYAARLAQEAGMLFVGSGISALSRLPTWKDLLRPFGKAIGIEISSEDDLPAIAQFIVNANKNNRGPLVQAIKEHLIGDLPLNSYHDSLQKTKVRTIWTTNYDTLLEDAFRQFVKDVKAHDDAITRSVPKHEIEIIKIHGCIATSPAKDLVLTLEDYEDFFIRRPATAERLRMDMLKNSFLFIGYSFGDPNIRNVIVEARRLAQKATRQHYMIQKAESDPSRACRQKHWVRDLRRVGIACVLIDNYNQLDSALRNIALKSRGRTLFITGGHKLQLPNASEYGKALADIPGLVLLDGQSEGVSRSVISAFTEECLRTRQDIRSRIRLFPNPYAIKAEFENDPNLLPELKKWRTPLLRDAQVMVVFPGSMGTEAELEVARDMRCFILPVPLQERDLPSRLIADDDVCARLKQRIPDYVQRAKGRDVTPKFLKESVLKLFSS